MSWGIIYENSYFGEVEEVGFGKTYYEIASRSFEFVRKNKKKLKEEEGEKKDESKFKEKVE